MRFLALLSCLCFAGVGYADEMFVFLSERPDLADISADYGGSLRPGKPGPDLTVGGPTECGGTILTGSLNEYTVFLSHSTNSALDNQVKIWTPNNLNKRTSFVGIAKNFDGGSSYTCQDDGSGVMRTYYKYIVPEPYSLADDSEFDACITDGQCIDKYGRLLAGVTGWSSGNVNNCDPTSPSCCAFFEGPSPDASFKCAIAKRIIQGNSVVYAFISQQGELNGRRAFFEKNQAVASGRGMACEALFFAHCEVSDCNPGGSAVCKTHSDSCTSVCSQ